MPFPARPAENADPWYETREAYDQAIEDEVTAHQTKLAGIATGATANSPDATLLARANHTGTQTAATIADFDTEVGNHADVAANTAARHTHANSAILAATTASFLTADKTKLDGIATGATANATNAELRARSSHTGTQLASTISDFAATVSAVTDVVNNTAARHTHSNKALLDTYTQTEANLADAVTKKHAHSNSAVLDATTASFLTADENKLDGIATGATANSSDATLLARANHTGTQSADTITDGTTNKAYTATDQTKLAGIEALADVTDATNVDAAGAVMEADTSTASMSFVIDEDSFASDSATKVPTQQSVKAYVDTEVAGVGGGVEPLSLPFISGSSGLLGYGHPSGLGTSATQANVAMSANTIYLHPFYLPVAVTLSATRFDVQAQSAGAANCRFGFYTYSTTLPTLIADVGTFSIFTTGFKDISGSASLPAGWFLIACLYEAACTMRTLTPNFKWVISPNNGSFYSGFTKAQAYGTLPSTVSSPGLSQLNYIHAYLYGSPT